MLRFGAALARRRFVRRPLRSTPPPAAGSFFGARWWHGSSHARAKAPPNPEEGFGLDEVLEKSGARDRQQNRKRKSFNLAIESAGKADAIGPQPEGREKFENFARFVLLPAFIGLAVIYFIHDYIVESAFGGDDTDLFDYMIGESFELAVANDQVMTLLGGQMSTDDARVQFISKEQGMRTIVILPLYGADRRVARCEVEVRTLGTGEFGVYSARVLFPGGRIIQLQHPLGKRYGGRAWQDNIARDQEVETAEAEEEEEGEEDEEEEPDEEEAPPKPIRRRPSRQDGQL